MVIPSPRHWPLKASKGAFDIPEVEWVAGTWQTIVVATTSKPLFANWCILLPVKLGADSLAARLCLRLLREHVPASFGPEDGDAQLGE